MKSMPKWSIPVIGILVLIAAWWILAVIFQATTGSQSIPSPIAVVVQMFQDGPSYYWPFFQVTLVEAGIGYFWGNLIALVLSAVVLLAPRFEFLLMQLAVLTYCVPIVAIGAIAIIVVGGSESPGQPSHTAIFLAGLSVFFTTVVGAILGFKAADKASLDVVYVYGGNKLTQLLKVRLIASLPSILNALQIAVPAAFLGAVLGEYMGKIERSIGTQLILAQQGMQTARVWSIFLLSALVALLGYWIVGLVAKAAAPWSSGKAGK